MKSVGVRIDILVLPSIEGTISALDETRWEAQAAESAVMEI